MIPNTFSLLNLKCWPRFHQTSLWYPPLTCFSPPEVSKTGQAGCFKIEVAKNIQSKRKNSLTCLLKMIKKRLGDILPQGHFAPLTKCPKTKCPKDILPQDILARISKIFGGGHIAPTSEFWWTFCPNFFLHISLAYLRQILAYLGYILGISRAYLGHIRVFNSMQ